MYTIFTDILYICFYTYMYAWVYILRSLFKHMCIFSRSLKKFTDMIPFIA